MPLLAGCTPDHWEVSHTDEIVQRVDFDKPVDLVGITANTPAAPHAYALAGEFRRRGVPVVIGGPHATLLPDEVARHADAVVVGEGELVWPQLLADFERGELKRIYQSCELPDLNKMPAPRWDLIKGRAYGKGVTIATRGCPFACDYCTIPQMYQRRMRYRPIGEVVAEIRRMPGRALIFWDDNLGANRDYAKELFVAITPLETLVDQPMHGGRCVRRRVPVPCGSQRMQGTVPRPGNDFASQPQCRQQTPQPRRRIPRDHPAFSRIMASLCRRASSSDSIMTIARFSERRSSSIARPAWIPPR